MTPADPSAVDAICAYVVLRTGTSLSRQQRERLAKAARASVGKGDPAAYLAFLKSRAGAHDLARLMSAISVHKTDLFRDEQQLEALRQHVLQPLATTARPLRLWSAGCSTGEEVATLLVMLAEVGAHQGSTVLATDISATALDTARTLTFGHEAMRRVPGPIAQRWFTARDRGAQLIPELRERARFLHHNLMDTPYPFSDHGELFDVIVCRNVFIYFTAEAVDRVVGRLAQRLKEGGVLVLSASEPILHSRSDLEVHRLKNAYFYVRPGKSQVIKPPPAPPPPRPSAPVPPPSAPPPLARSPSSGEFPALLTPEQEGQKLFELVLEWAAAGQSDQETEGGLRRALYLAPELAAARYMLGLLLEQRKAVADAANEYRRALSVLEAGRAMPTPFFLNNDRLLAACRLALGRLPGARM